MTEENISATMTVGASIVEVIQRVCDKIDAKMLVEPDWQCVGKITYKSGINRYFRLSTLDLNTMAASETARDKDYARFFLASMGYPIAKGRSFLSDKWGKALKCEDRGIDAAWDYAKSIGLPVFVKPNSRSRGVGVSKASNKKEFYKSARTAFKEDKVILVEQELFGNDYRVVVLDGKVISAYHRIPFTIYGDGNSTILDLIENTEKEFRKLGREETINKDDFRIKRTLERKNLNFMSVLEKGRPLKMLDNANLSSGGTSIDVTESISEGFKEVAKNVSRDMGLRLVGVDFMINGSIQDNPKDGAYWIIEINSAPGLDHYATMGDKQQSIVDQLYYEVIVAMERPQERIV